MSFKRRRAIQNMDETDQEEMNTVTGYVAPARVVVADGPRSAVFQSGSASIRPDEVTQSGLLGQGAYGKVYRGKCRGMDVAIKRANAIQDIAQRKEFAREMEILSRLSHPNITLFMGACVENDEFFIVQELMSGGDLHAYIQRGGHTLMERMKLARDIALGMAWLHGNNPAVVHRDLKPANILLTKDKATAKVGDFGLSLYLRPGTYLQTDEPNPRGSPYWMSPEVLQQGNVNEKSDVYSYAIILWQLVRNKARPYPSNIRTFHELKHAVVNEGIRPTLDSRDGRIPTILRELLSDAWHADPDVRPTFKDLIERLDDATVHCVVHEPTARELWTYYFRGASSVPWPDLYLRLFQTIYPEFAEFDEEFSYPCSAEELQELSPKQLVAYRAIGERPFRNATQELLNRGMSEQDIIIEYPLPFANENGELAVQCLRAVLARGDVSVARRDESHFVSTETFGEVCSYFGPLSDLFENLWSIVSQPWFFGYYSKHEAESKLQDKEPGTFLVRFSSFAPGFFLHLTSVETTRNRARTHRSPRRPPVSLGPTSLRRTSRTCSCCS